MEYFFFFCYFKCHITSGDIRSWHCTDYCMLSRNCHDLLGKVAVRFSIFFFNGFQFKVAMPLKCSLPKVNEYCIPCCFNYGMREKRQIHTFARAILKKINITEETEVWTQFVDFTLISQNGYVYCILLKEQFFWGTLILLEYKKKLVKKKLLVKKTKLTLYCHAVPHTNRTRSCFFVFMIKV